MSGSASFSPNWASAPGVAISQRLRDLDLDEIEFAKRLGCDLIFTENLLAGNAGITADIATSLERIIGSTARFWLAREQKYRSELGRLYGIHNLAAVDEWFNALPIRDMTRFGWLKVRSVETRAVDCLRFFGVASIDEWKRRYEEKIRAFAFRTSAAFDTNPAAVAAWLRRGEVEAASVSCADWNRDAFVRILPLIRKLTRTKSPRIFLPQLQALCGQCGVALVVVRAPDGCRASGAANLVESNRALIQLSIRYSTDDQFWFSFFHEAGHLIKHGDKGMFIDGLDGVAGKLEVEANSFARDVLLPPDQMRELLGLQVTYDEVIRFSRRIGISAGIAVGQLQHAGRINRSWLNGAKRTLDWEGIAV